VSDALKQSLAESEVVAATTLPESSDKLRWAFINGWKVEPQTDDRPPLVAKSASSAASRSVYRSSARRKHQAMFKAWSQERHD